MIVATDALRPPKIRIGHIGGNFSLPRTVPLATLIAGAGTGLFGLTVAFIFFHGGIGPVVYGGGLGAAAGVFAVTWSPLKGESLAKWLGLSVRNRRTRIELNGETVQLAVGIAVLSSVTTGTVRVAAGAVNVPPSQYDERGVRVDSGSVFDQLLDERGRAGAPWIGSMPGSQRLEDVEELWIGRTNHAQVSRAIGAHRDLIQRRGSVSNAGGAAPIVPGAGTFTPRTNPEQPSSEGTSVESSGARFGAPLFGSSATTSGSTVTPRPPRPVTKVEVSLEESVAFDAELGDLFAETPSAASESTRSEAALSDLLFDDPADDVTPRDVASPPTGPTGGGWTKPASTD